VSPSAIVSEIGGDMSRFPTAGTWSPGVGCVLGTTKARQAQTFAPAQGAPWLTDMLVQCAWAAKRKKDSYYRAQFFRLQSKRGPQKDTSAPVAASILTASTTSSKTASSTMTSRLLLRSAPVELKAGRLVAHLKKLGFNVHSNQSRRPPDASTQQLF